jgi:long-chain acyl-CoA synthetase
MQAFALSEANLLRVSRDLAYSEIASMPGLKAQLGPRVTANPNAPTLSWAADTIDLDSLARMQLATAGAVWCNAYDAGFEDLFLAKRTAADWAATMRRAREAGAAHMTFSTSGSTGARKHIRHREHLLAAEARAWVQVLEQSPFGKIRRVVVLCPTHHIYGFIWGVLLPMALGVPVIDADLSCLPEFEPNDLVVAVPDQWAWLASSTRSWPAGVQGISSTAPLPAAVHDAMTLARPAPSGEQPPALARLLQIYGSSETAGLAWRSTSSGAYTLAPERQRSASGGIGLQLSSGAVQALAVQDELQWLDESRFMLLRRSDESVQVGGHNVSPEWVVAQLQTHSAVKLASVRLDTGATPAKLKAFIVLHGSSDANFDNDARAMQQADLELWVKNTLPWYANFSSMTYGAELPLNAMGKASDWHSSH